MAAKTTIAFSGAGVGEVTEEEMIGDTMRVICSINPADAGETVTITHGGDRTGTRNVRIIQSGLDKTATTAVVTSITRTSETVTTIVYPVNVAVHLVVLEWKR